MKIIRNFLKKNNETGVSLIEILLAITIIVFATIAIIESYLVNINFSELNKERTVTLSHLSNMMEAIKCTPFSNITVNFPNGIPDGTSSNSYTTIVGGYLLKNEHIIVSYTNPNSDPLEVIITVNWQDKIGINRTNNLVTKRTR